MTKFFTDNEDLFAQNRICNLCKHNYYDNTCRAFPDKIPDNIWDKHEKPLKDQDNDIVFELKK